MPKKRTATDGRLARGQRTRESIVSAHTDLIRSGELKPTASQIADRAGVSIRSLWLNFTDMEGLLRATTGHWLAEDDKLLRDIDPQLRLEDRIDAFCDQRARRLEHISPAAKAASLGEPFSTALRSSRQAHGNRVLREVAKVFATELARAHDEREQVFFGVVVASSWPAWSLMRDDCGLTVDQSRSTMVSSMRRILG